MDSKTIKTVKRPRLYFWKLHRPMLQLIFQVGLELHLQIHCLPCMGNHGVIRLQFSKIVDVREALEKTCLKQVLRNRLIWTPWNLCSPWLQPLSTPSSGKNNTSKPLLHSGRHHPRLWCLHLTHLHLFFWKIWSQNGCHCISASNKCLQISSTPGVQRDFKSFLNKCNWPQSDAITHPALLFFLDFFFFEDELDDPDELPLLLLLLPSLPWNQRLIQSSSTSSVASVSRTQNCRPAWQSNMHAWFSAGPPNCFSSGHVNLYFRVPWFYLRFDFPAAM